jgi:hypothetical protein
MADEKNRLNRALGAKMQQVQRQSNRGAYEHLRDQQAGGNINSNALVTEGYLRSEVALATQNVLKFPINVGNAPAAGVAEKRLDTSDGFCVTHIGMFLRVTENPEFSRLVSYDSTAVNTGGNVYAFYNGSLSVRINQTVYFDRYDMLRFYRVGCAQAGLAVSDVVTTGVTVANSWENLNNGFSPIVPFISFTGTDTNDFRVDLPVNIDLTANVATAVMILRGLLIQNV